MRFHDLRHSVATLLLRERVDAHRVQRLLRHRDVKTTTGTYGHLVVGDLREAINLLPPAPFAASLLRRLPLSLLSGRLRAARILRLDVSDDGRRDWSKRIQRAQPPPCQDELARGGGGGERSGGGHPGLRWCRAPPCQNRPRHRRLSATNRQDRTGTPHRRPMDPKRPNSKQDPNTLVRSSAARRQAFAAVDRA